MLKRKDQMLFFTSNGTWTPHLSDAMDFASVDEALAARTRWGLLQAEVFDAVKGRPVVYWDSSAPLLDVPNDPGIQPPPPES